MLDLFYLHLFLIPFSRLHFFSLFNPFLHSFFAFTYSCDAFALMISVASKYLEISGFRTKKQRG